MNILTTEFGSSGETADELHRGHGDQVLGSTLNGGIVNYGTLASEQLSRGMHPGKVDGIFGLNTKAAVIQFQKNGDRVSNIKGVVGPLTWGGIFGD